MQIETTKKLQLDRCHFIGGSDARIIMGQHEKALIRLWREKRGEVGPEDLSANLIVHLGLVTEDLNLQWYARNTGQAITDVQNRVQHPVIRSMAATLDGVVPSSLLAPSEPNSSTTAVLIDELNPGRLERVL
jgi:predicted phage-related endonuclease